MMKVTYQINNGKIQATILTSMMVDVQSLRKGIEENGGKVLAIERNRRLDALEAARLFCWNADKIGLGDRLNGFWVSSGGGTFNVAAGEIARETGSTFEESWEALKQAAQEFWGDDWGLLGQWPNGVNTPDPDEYALDVRDVVEMALGGVIYA